MESRKPMTTSSSQIREGSIIVGSLFNEPMRVETVRVGGDGTWTVGLVGTQSERFRKVTLTASDIHSLTILDSDFSYDGDGRLLRLGLQAYSLGIAYEFDPYFGLSISRVDPLPHQLEAVYDYLLKLARVRFLLADDAGAGKTIMAGLLIRELQLRGLAERILVVCPANLSFQWQRELKEKFDEKFLVLKGGDIRDQFGVNQWIEQNKIITSLDLAKRSEILPGLRQVHWDLIIVDEAHRMSWTPPARKTARYALGELLRDTADHYLLLTATPHKGDPKNFSLFLQLLDKDAYADVKSIHEAMDRRRAPFYLRRTKEAMVYFPKRCPDGTWVAEKIFTKRIPHTVDFQIDGAEFELYRDITRFVKRQSAKAAAQGDDPRARAVGFLMSLYQRRLASSTHAMRRSLENRVRRLEEGLKHAQELAHLAPPDLPDPEELEEMEEDERERLERMLEAITLAGNAKQVREEIEELKQLAGQAQAVENAGAEAKLSQLKNLLQEEGFFDHSDQRLLLFTEFKDTLNYLIENLKSWGFKVGCIHGGMKPGSRDDPGTRLYAEQQFRDGAIQVLAATEAAGEGINLQCCNILFNYDIPWNPNRLEQRMGRIHRYGQHKDCLIFNFVATNTIEGRVLQRLMEKLQEIRDALDDDAVFNVVGEILPAALVERILRDYYAGKLGEVDLEERLLKNVDERQFRAIYQNALEGLASKKLNLEMLVERRAQAQERRVVPETITRFIHEAAEYVPLKLKMVDALPHAFEPARTPPVLRGYEREPDWKLPALANKYSRCSADRDTAEKNNLEWVTPGHPLFEAVRRHTFQSAHEPFSKGACFYSLQHEEPSRLDFYRARVVDGLGQVVHERLFVVEIVENGDPYLREPGMLGDFSPAKPLPTEASAQAGPRELPAMASAPEATAMRVVMEHEEAQVRQVYDVHEKNLGYDITSLDLNSGELRLIEVKGLGAETGTILLTPNERRVAGDRRDCYWLYIVTNCADMPTLQEPVKDPARLEWHEVTKVAHYYLSVNAMTQPMQVREDEEPYGKRDQ
jgi:superfamily II DNA or RNA helicase